MGTFSRRGQVISVISEVLFPMLACVRYDLFCRCVNSVEFICGAFTQFDDSGASVHQTSHKGSPYMSSVRKYLEHVVLTIHSNTSQEGRFNSSVFFIAIS